MDHLFHFLGCFFLVIFLSATFSKRMFWFAILSVFFLGGGKEIRDLIVNPWNLSLMELWKDSMWDLVCNQLGIIMAADCLKKLNQPEQQGMKLKVLDVKNE